MAVIQYYGIMREETKKLEEIIEGKNINSIVKTIRNNYGKKTYQVCKKSVILVDNKPSAQLSGYATKVTKETVLKIMPICGGG